MIMAEASQVLIQKGLKIVHGNVRSLLPKLPEIEKQFRGFDVIILTETWLSESVPSGAVVIDGYNLIRQDRWKYIKKKGGGLCCYIKTDVTYRNMLDLTEPVTSDYEIMGLVICPPNSKKVNVLAVYRPPDGKAQVFMDKLVGVVGNLDREHKETIKKQSTQDHLDCILYCTCKSHEMLKKCQKISHTGANFDNLYI